jgi:outer membrane protein assembly factor BamB
MKRFIIAVAVAALATVAGAHDGGGGGRGPGGPGPGGPGFDDRRPGGLIIATDGTVFVRKATSSGTTTTEQVQAISASGTTLWTATLPTGAERLTLSGNNLIAVSDTSTTSANITTVTSTLTAINTATGAIAWTLTIDGRIDELRPFSGGTYAVVTTPATTSGGTATRTLKAISSSGAILWSIAL